MPRVRKGYKQRLSSGLVSHRLARSWKLGAQGRPQPRRKRREPSAGRGEHARWRAAAGVSGGPCRNSSEVGQDLS